MQMCFIYEFQNIVDGCVVVAVLGFQLVYFLAYFLFECFCVHVCCTELGSYLSIFICETLYSRVQYPRDLLSGNSAIPTPVLRPLDGISTTIATNMFETVVF